VSTGGSATALDRSGNLLGALSLAVADRTADAVGDAAGQSETAAIALSALHQFLERPSVGLLRQVLGLTPSGTVRLLDRLQDAGYVERRPGVDGRSVSVELTASGRRAAERVAAARAEVLDEALSPLAPAEREAFEDALARVLPGLIRGPGATRWMCRLCDMKACGREHGKCPVERAARERYGPGRPLGWNDSSEGAETPPPGPSKLRFRQ
jgi:DNA-binding MarR family transcriptional regulator